MKRLLRGRAALAVPFLVLLTAGAALVQGRFDDVQVVGRHLAGPIHWLEGAGGNVGVSAGEDGLLQIDGQFAELAPKIDAVLDELGRGRPRLLINTHWHGDHTGGNVHFGADALIVAQENVFRRLAGDEGVAGRRNDPPTERAGLPTVTFDDDLTLHWNGEEVRVIHFPSSHTDGDSIVWFTGSKVAHLGDLYFAGRFPFVDLGSGGDATDYVRSVGRLLELLPADTTLIPGHGSVTGMEELRAWHGKLVESLERVRAALGEGKDARTMVEEGLLDDLGREMSWDFISTERFTTTLAESLSR